MTGRCIGANEARHDGFKSVRLRVDGKDLGFATTNYAYALAHEERVEAAKRIAVLWNLALGVSTEQLEENLATRL